MSLIQGDIPSPMVSFYLNPIGNEEVECINTSIFPSISMCYVIKLTNMKNRNIFDTSRGHD